MNDAVTKAETEARAARDAYDDLEQRIKSGDMSVTQTQLDDAKRTMDYTALRAEGTRAQAEKDAEANRKQKIAELRSEARTILARESAELQKAVTAAERALAKVGAQTRAFNEARGDLHSRREQLRPAHVSLDQPLPAELSGLFDYGTPLHDFSPVKLSLAALGEALKDCASWMLPGDAQAVRDYGRGTVREDFRVLRETSDYLNAERK